MADDDAAAKGFTRREAITRAAVAGAVVWAAPMLESSAAWGSTGGDCNQCNGLTLYSKYAPGNSNTAGNQCLSPCPPVTIISSSVLTACGLITTADVVRSGESFSQIGFSSAIHLIRTAIKSTNDCYISRCTDNFCSVAHTSPSDNPPCNQEAISPVLTGPLTPPVFSYFAPDPNTLCGSAPTGSPCGCSQEIRKVEYSTAGIPGTPPLNYIEILMCLKGTSNLPPGCA